MKKRPFIALQTTIKFEENGWRDFTGMWHKKSPSIKSKGLSY
jgi:hypothetical protein